MGEGARRRARVREQRFSRSCNADDCTPRPHLNGAVRQLQVAEIAQDRVALPQFFGDRGDCRRLRAPSEPILHRCLSTEVRELRLLERGYGETLLERYRGFHLVVAVLDLGQRDGRPQGRLGQRRHRLDLRRRPQDLPEQRGRGGLLLDEGLINRHDPATCRPHGARGGRERTRASRRCSRWNQGLQDKSSRDFLYIGRA